MQKKLARVATAGDDIPELVSDLSLWAVRTRPDLIDSPVSGIDANRQGVLNPCPRTKRRWGE
jgi:hypothetical protein